MIRHKLGFLLLLAGCHPQAAAPGTPKGPPPLDRELVESVVQSRMGELSACSSDADARIESAVLELWIGESGRVQTATVQKVDDVDLKECLIRRAKDWMFPSSGFTGAHVELRLQSPSAELRALRVLRGGPDKAANAR